MRYFNNDYLEGAHPLVLQHLIDTNLVQTVGYGEDPYCEQAKEKIRAACHCPAAAVHFLVGGTQTNATLIGAMLLPYQGVIAADTGHISTHEAGAIEHGGHKILALPHQDGKLTPEQIEQMFLSYYEDDAKTHTVMPGMVYLSHPTEFGTLYTKAELEAISALCHQYDASLYLDGARLGYALAAEDTDVTLLVLASLCDAFYIGGTKVGALFGEALVISDPDRLPHFFSIMKQNGAVLAKGRLLGIQFDALFTDGLYEKIGVHALAMAKQIKAALLERGYCLTVQSPTNQIFVRMQNQKLEEFGEQIGYTVSEREPDGHTIIRLVTDWATKQEDVEALIALL